jgi:thiopeptide-type bacteriocin biosynthesis protein
MKRISLPEPQPAVNVDHSVFVRLATLPVNRVRDTWRDIDLSGTDDVDIPADFLRKLCADPLVVEAIQIASPSLGSALRKLETGDTVPPAQLHRAVLSATKYLLRMTTRPTPFGLMAGVALGAVAAEGEPGRAEFGTRHLRGVRPDYAYLNSLISQTEISEELAERIRVAPNNLCLRRGARLVNPNPRKKPDTAHGSETSRETSIRATAPVREALRLAASAPTLATLCQQLVARYPSGHADQIKTMVRTLLAEGYLISDLMPTLDVDRRLEHVSNRLSSSDSAEFAELAECIMQYDATALGDGTEVLSSFSPRSMGAETNTVPIQVDLRLDADVRLPRVVAQEVERASDVLRTVGSIGFEEPPHLRQYREAMLERYGSQLVPIKGLLDPEFGLDAPAGYRSPASRRETVHAETDSRHRDSVLTEWVQEAMLDENSTIDLDEARIARLLPEPESIAEPSGHELSFQLIAPSMAHIERGEFHLAAGGLPGAPSTQCTVGRFMYLFDEIDDFRRVAQLDAPDTAERKHARLVFDAITPRMGNVASHPTLHELTVPVGTFHDVTDPDVVDLDDIVVGATHHRLFVRSLSRGVELVPLSQTMLTYRRGTNNVARLLREIGSANRNAGMLAWDWGACAGMSYLPRITSGRTILAPCQWRPPAALCEAGLSATDFDRELDAWRSRWKVPAHIRAAVRDNQMELNLEYGLHRRLLQAELRKTPDMTILEVPLSDTDRFGWIDGHANELVFQITPRSRPAASPSAPVLNHRVHRAADRAHPGGDWLFAKVYASDGRHRELLAGPIAELIEGVSEHVDRWFFLRYRDPDSHLRLRLHGDASVMNLEVLPQVNSLLSGLATAGYINRFTIAEYEPEVDRYGGGPVLEAAERAFTADSAAALDMLKAGLDDTPAEVLGALAAAHAAMGLVGDGWREWLLANYPKYTESKALRATRPLLLKLLRSDAALQRLDDMDDVGPSLAEIFRRRHDAFAAYRDSLAAAAGTTDLPASIDDAFRGILHMHHNRFFGISRGLENLNNGAVRGAIQAIADRERLGR